MTIVAKILLGCPEHVCLNQHVLLLWSRVLLYEKVRLADRTDIILFSCETNLMVPSYDQTTININDKQVTIYYGEESNVL